MPTTKAPRRGDRTRAVRPRGWVVLLAVVALVVGLAACSDSEDETSTDDGTSGSSSSDDGGEPQVGGSLTMLRTGTTPATWDPTDPSADGMTDPGGSGVFLEAVFGVLAYEDYASGEVVPSLAESITSEDGTTWTLTLREGITFSDGTPYDAEAVKVNWERHLDPELTSPQATTVEGIETMTVVDATTLEVVLAAPNTQFDRLVARSLPFIGSPTAIEEDLDGFRSNPVGAGPFVLEDYVAEQEATFSRNPSYWDDPKPYLDELVIRSITDDEQRYNAFITGEGQLMQVFGGYSHVEEAESQGYQVVTTAANGGTGLLINHSRAPFDDLAARQALSVMFDAARRSETLEFGVTQPVTNLFAEGNPYRVDDVELPQYDPEQAQELLDEYADENGEPLTFSISTYEGNREAAELYQAQLAEFDNLEVDLELVAANEYPATLAGGSFDVAFYPFTFGDPVDSFRANLTTDGELNFGKYSNPELDELVAEASAAAEVEERAGIFADVQQIVAEDVPYVFLTDNPDVQLAVEGVHDLEHAIDGIPLWDRVWLES